MESQGRTNTTRISWPIALVITDLDHWDANERQGTRNLPSAPDMVKMKPSKDIPYQPIVIGKPDATSPNGLNNISQAVALLYVETDPMKVQK